MSVVKRMIEWTRQPTQTSRGWVLGVYIVGVTLMIVVGWSWRTDAERFRAAAERDSAAAIAAVTQARYENDRDERLRCEQRVESREQIRSVFLGVADRLGADAETIAIVSSFLDEEYPALVLSDCPPPPTAPGGTP